MRTAPAGIDDEIGLDRLRVGRAALLHAYPGNAPATAIKDRLHDFALLAKAKSGELAHPMSHALLQCWAADQEPKQSTRCIVQIDAIVEPQGVVGDIAIERRLRDQLLAEAGKQLLEDFATAGQQPVGVAPLRHSFALLASFGQRVAFENRHGLVMVGRARAARRPPMLAPVTTACRPRCTM